MKTLVSLVSQQTIPNVLFIREHSDCDRYLFISTKKMESLGQTAAIIKASQISSDVCKTIEVDENSVSDIKEKLKLLEYPDDETFIVNLTGGTKIMSIAIHDFFLSEKSNEMYYLPIDRNLSLKVFPVVRNIESSVQVRLDLEDYLTAYSINFPDASWSSKNALTKEYRYTTGLLHFFLEDKFKHAVSPLREKRRTQRYNFSSEESKHINQLLSVIQYGKDSNGLNKNDVEYLTGGWFEEFVYSTVKDVLSLNDESIGLNIQIERNNARNEIDVMFTVANSLFFIECKTGLMDGDKHLFNDTMYKIAALRRDFGLTAKSFLFTLDKLRDAQGKLQEKYEVRKNALSVEVLDRTDFSRADCIKEIFQSIPK